jgi:transcriptional regulator, tetR family
LRTRLRIVADNPELAAAAIHSNNETITTIATALTARGVDKLTATALATAVIAGLTRALIDWSTHINRPLMPTLRSVLHALAGTHA